MLSIRGPFGLRGPGGADLAPAGQKERAILAVLALSPDRRRSRRALQHLLWSDRSDEQAAVSLRRALSNIRRAGGDLSDLIEADRSSVRLLPEVELAEDPAGGALLDDIAVRDPAWLAWLREARLGLDGPPAPGGPVVVDPAEILAERPAALHVVIRSLVPQDLHEPRFLARFFCDMMATRLRSMGDIEVEFEETTAPRDAAGHVLMEVESAVAGEEWYVHLRMCAGPQRRFLWARRLRLPMDLRRICEGPETSAFVSRAISAMLARMGPERRDLPWVSLQRASQKVFLGDRDQLDTADHLLERVEPLDGTGVVQAWRGYVRLTRALEFGDFSDLTLAEAEDFATRAVRMGAGGPLIGSLAAQVRMKLAGDIDHGAWLARQAHDEDDRDPWALHAMSQARVFQGDREAAHAYALLGQTAASGLPNAWCWDMQCCLTALGTGRIEDAWRHARTAHVQMPTYRPALRYLVALAALTGRREDLLRFAADLARIEPGFAPSRLLDDGYPIETLRLLGLKDDLAQRLVA